MERRRREGVTGLWVWAEAKCGRELTNINPDFSKGIQRGQDGVSRGSPLLTGVRLRLGEDLRPRMGGSALIGPAAYSWAHHMRGIEVGTGAEVGGAMEPGRYRVEALGLSRH